MPNGSTETKSSLESGRGPRSRWQALIQPCRLVGSQAIVCAVPDRDLCALDGTESRADPVALRCGEAFGTERFYLFIARVSWDRSSRAGVQCRPEPISNRQPGQSLRIPPPRPDRSGFGCHRFDGNGNGEGVCALRSRTP